MGFLILPFHNQPDDEWAFSFSLLWGCSGLGVFSLGMMKGLSLSLWLLVCCSVCNIAMLRNCHYATHPLSPKYVNASVTMLELQIKSR
ncbi:hypothetical protein BDR26DRAFT_883975 [Obelidium mucronatum]|nr:hypothetical protein BDR26DRAFT_883975 [Obelidium mucronatum]